MHRYQAVVLVASLVAAGAAPLGTTSSSALQETSAVAELKRLESVWNDAHVKGDTQSLDALIAEDAVITVPGMTRMTKQQSLGVLKQGVMTFKRYQTTDIEVRTYETAATVSGKLRRTRVAGAGSADDNWLFTKSYVQRSGKWIVVAFTASPAPQ